MRLPFSLIEGSLLSTFSTYTAAPSRITRQLTNSGRGSIHSYVRTKTFSLEISGLRACAIVSPFHLRLYRLRKEIFACAAAKNKISRRADHLDLMPEA